ncbi:MAG: deoxynucleoside kinase [Gallionellales bacterium 35-53-114]|jgi:deoxyadenosine/deoxycytidine kinase|nr:MAG: deoxynucleoside kinase [Gallionellales bacterium 35-53-114]OYZ63298.1 MAG: deoxynucleoside kinase [Gallionellales bacterium 24-53-125]OZB08760.1 MAG: deoxynucleoside kinase [Gallionellales bacterium 39-52-133]HQS57364.1 deoxynucleoside kinase [Gallionellaceae bacterium]HQS74448.1 deoxynucleoside kinase [Gallionellaceae bacterium]
MMLEKYRYIVVEGPIGVGKTSLAQRLADHLGADILLEKPQDNPFLERFYQDPQRHAMSTQLFFLFQRINELRDQAQMDLFNTRTVSDYLFEKDALFARLNLSDDEYKLYQNIYQSLAPQAPTPDLVIYLQASTDTLFERVHRRGRNYEKSLTDDYLTRLGNSYGDFFHQYEEAPLMMVNSENLNFVDNDDDFKLLLQRIESMRGPREFFSLGV